MERPHKHKSMLLKLLPKPANSAVNFQNTPFSPGRDHHRSSTKLKSHAYKGFSGPINFALLPEEARVRPKCDEPGFETREPTSPKVSCMGQIKHKHKNKKNKKLMSNDHDKSPPSKSSHQDEHYKQPKPKQAKKSSSAISRLFSRPAARKRTGSTSSNHEREDRLAAPDNDKMPSLGQMKKFASGRESLADFDWTAQIAPIDHDRDYYSDGEGGIEIEAYDEGRLRGEREVIIPHSAPLLVGGRGGGLGMELEPRKEVNLWKRRIMAPPPPLALNSKVRS